MNKEDAVNGLRVIHATAFYSSPGLRPARIILVQRDVRESELSREEREFITAYHCIGDSGWVWGNYFHNLTDAFDDYMDRAGKHRHGKSLASQDEINAAIEDSIRDRNAKNINT